ncbi:MAG: bifunctional nicotinamidase/pyrazinamidase [Acidimicrobiia bacterium]|nr:bifunctional nicotinamidase/pyrazinamidase [Acidimicrobiia bacterium]
MKALILIDIQRDFLPGGALAVADGDAVVPVANELIDQHELVIATQDWHPADHRSFASQHEGREPGEVIDLDGLDQVLWPDHCVQGTDGAAFAPGLDVDRIDHVVRKGTDRDVDSYSGFFDNARRKRTELEDLLHRLDVDEVELIGLATDYCVQFTALDAADLGFRTAVVAAGCRAVDLVAGDGDRALDAMRAAGVDVR